MRTVVALARRTLPQERWPHRSFSPRPRKSFVLHLNTEKGQKDRPTTFSPESLARGSLIKCRRVHLKKILPGALAALQFRKGQETADGGSNSKRGSNSPALLGGPEVRAYQPGARPTTTPARNTTPARLPKQHAFIQRKVQTRKSRFGFNVFLVACSSMEMLLPTLKVDFRFIDDRTTNPVSRLGQRLTKFRGCRSGPQKLSGFPECFFLKRTREFHIKSLATTLSRIFRPASLPAHVLDQVGQYVQSFGM